MISQDCLQGEIEPVGEFLPEFLALGQGRKAQAYFMYLTPAEGVTKFLTSPPLYSRCCDCIELFVSDPAVAVRFEEEKAETMAKLKEMGMES